MDCTQADDAAVGTHAPDPGDLYQHLRTRAFVVVLTVKKVAGETLVRLGRPGYETPLETELDVFLEKFEWTGMNVLTLKESDVLSR